MQKISIFSVSDKKPIDIIYVELNSIKNAKEDSTVIDYYLIIEDLDNKVEQYFEDLQSPDFNIILLNARDYSKYIDPPAKTYLYYVRCLTPRIFKHLDKILYLDTDIVCAGPGIEELWNTDLTNKYLAAAIDIEQSYRDQAERINVGKDVQNNNYVNSGVMLLNLKKWRDQGYDKIFQQYLLSWPKDLQPILMDQTLINYVFKQGIKVISTKYNNSILSMTQIDTPHYWRYYGTQNLLEKMNDVVLIHLKGPKPYHAVNAWIQYNMPHRKLAQQVYGQLYGQFGKHEEF